MSKELETAQHDKVNQITEEEYVSLSTEELLSRTVRRTTEPDVLTSKELIEINRQRVFDCARLGVTKIQAAYLISKDPRNVAGIKAPTIMRDMNDVVGKWNELVRKPRIPSVPVPNNLSSLQESSREHILSPKRFPANPFLDKNFNDGDVL